jgi:sorbitol/mannitol transport system substrate-binding protein
MVGNPQMVVLDELLPEFNKAYPNVTVNNRIVPENEVRQIITQDISTQAGQFDVVTIGTFEVPLWGANGWLEPMDAVAADPAYDVEDIFQAHRDGLSADGVLYGLPFYGESAMTFYRTDPSRAAGLTMPERPTFEELGTFARALHKPEEEIYGIALRGLPGWGQQLAVITCIINAYGGRWFNENWESQLGSEKSRAATPPTSPSCRRPASPAPTRPASPSARPS